MVALTDWQWEVRGLVGGPGTDYRTAGLEGFYGREVDAPDVALASGGQVPGLDRITSQSAKVLTTSWGKGQLGNSPGQVMEMLQVLSSAWQVGEDVEFRYCLPGLGTRMMIGRTRRFLPDLEKVKVGYGEAICEFVPSNPLSLDDTELSARTSRELIGDGILAPFATPFSLPANTISGIVEATASGNAPSPWRCVIVGAITNPVLTHIGSGMKIDLRANGGIDLQVGETVVVDSRNKSIILQGTADRRVNLTLGSEWFDLEVGLNHLKLEADSGTGTATFYWRNAWY